MSPLKIEILLQFHYSADGYTGQSLGSPAYEWAIMDFLAHGLLQPRGKTFELTDRGSDTVKRICEVPMWEIPVS